ncbi:serine hydrolase [Pedobacter cryoconitis]|uniref:CubicO group peptidase (Beta-lactamase class C family) n=1 Tax=Pedobacter cryoconitis TaxID=188932 RepID=A0A7X0J519_9SPHI|nr:serine hydrolase [Pedobacter cryoconitis]MBB6501205.1 CubicO group peptidase (beta-lactamase class C family) [Pedobacter cryoconitis]
MKTILLFILAASLNFNYVNAQTNHQAEIDTLMRRASQNGLFNGNILVAENNKVIYKAAIGFADASGKIPLTDRYRFQIGSIAKEFNAVGIMMLKEQGKLKLEDPVSKYLPELPSWANKVKIINILQYTSGLPDIKWDSVNNDADNFAILKKLQKLNFEPGTGYFYNNNNVFLQRRIIEKITGSSFKEFVEQKLLKPCGMKTAIIDPTEDDKLVARGYNDDHQQDKMLIPITGWTAVTLDDFYKWAKAITEFKFINPTSTKELLEAYANGQSGLGGGTMEGNQVTYHKHDGSNWNYQALLVSTVTKGRTVILMTNNKQNNVYAINTSIQAILDGKPYSQIKKSLINALPSPPTSMDGTQILAFYEKMKREHEELYSFDESTLNEIGYLLMGKKKIADAILVFEYNTELFPASGNVFDSLGEAYYTQGNKEKALLNYKKSISLNPDNGAAKRIIAELEK